MHRPDHVPSWHMPMQPLGRYARWVFCCCTFLWSLSCKDKDARFLLGYDVGEDRVCRSCLTEQSESVVRPSNVQTVALHT